jgi:hypothetical protein
MDEEYKVKSSGAVFIGFDILDLVSFISRLTKRYQANLLADIETSTTVSTEDYRVIRKLVLDSTNNFSRSLVKTIFGDIEIPNA